MKRVLVALAVLTLLILSSESAQGAFRGAAANSGSSLRADALSPPTQLVVTFRCTLITGLFRPVADLAWQPSTSQATGYQLERWRNGNLDAVTTIGGASTSAFSDGLGVVDIQVGTPYTWRLRTRRGSWESTKAEVSGSTPVVCL